jgi:chromosomal replication initiator protein
MWIARQLTSRSLVEIGTFFGDRDHGTVIHACNVVPDKMAQNKDFARKARAALAEAKHALGQGGARK